MLDARDPICGMTVEVTTAYSEAVGGQTYYFCSENCREQFDENPGRYGAASSGGGSPSDRDETSYTNATWFAHADRNSRH